MSFVMLGIVLAMVMLVGFLIVMNDSKDDEAASRMKDLGFELQREIILASEVHEGYERTIFIPSYLGKMEYELNNTATILVLSYDGTDYPFPIPNVNGTLQKGDNIIKNIGGEIFIG